MRKGTCAQGVRLKPWRVRESIACPLPCRYTFERPRLRCILPDVAGEDTRLLLLAETVHERGDFAASLTRSKHLAAHSSAEESGHCELPGYIKCVSEPGSSVTE